MKKYLRSYSWFTVDRFIANTVWTSIQYVISIGLNSIVSRMSELPKTTLFKFVESVKWSREWEKRDRSIVRSFVRSKFENSKIRKWKEKDARNSESTATENVFRLRSKKREGRGGGVWMLPHRSDTSRGHLHPPLTLSPYPQIAAHSLLHDLSFSFLLSSFPSRVVSPGTNAYAATFLEALARWSNLPSPFSPWELRAPNGFELVPLLRDATAIVYASNLNPSSRTTLPA